MIPKVEISVNNGNKVLMQPCCNAMYESKINLNHGINRYSVYFDGILITSNEIFCFDAIKEKFAYVRYFPFGNCYKLNNNTKKIEVIDSINNKDLFAISATLVGEFNNFSKEYLNEQINDWDINSNFARLEYMGAGIFAKEFKLKKTLLHPYVLNYKIVINNSWDNAIGLSNGANITKELKPGTTSFEICIDTLNNKITDTISHFKNCIKTEEFIKPINLNSNICLNLKENNVLNETLKFNKISDKLYSSYVNIPKGDYEYHCTIDDTFIDEKNLTGKLNLAEDKDAIFIFDISQPEIINSIDNPELICAKLEHNLPKSSQELDSLAYNGDDLGVNYTKEKTKFKVWAPKASEVKVCLYNKGTDNEENSKELKEINMQLKPKGVWFAQVNEDLKDLYYTYKITVGENTFETIDIYAKAAGVNGKRGMIFDFNETNPKGWENDKKVRCQKPTDAIIWETSVRDFSSAISSGVSEKNRGKYLAFTEKSTTLNNNGKDKTCISYLKELGITHVHILPSFDFATIDETSCSEAYNWGYDPLNYNLPEGSYSSNPFDGKVRIKEFKQMVQALHQENIGIIMDVVYNHTYFTQSSAFNLTVPNYYYRFFKNDFANASGCGNETASERAMFRKYMIDSITYWAKEYHIDGFRFDLMGIHDIQTMNEIRKELNKLENGEEILIYGEPWSALPTSQDIGTNVCTKNNMQLLNEKIGAFNDNIRDAVVGKINHSVESLGFVEGFGNNSDLKAAILGQNISLGQDRLKFWAKASSQVINYVSCHDNYTLYDKLVAATKGGQNFELRYNDIVRMNKLSAAIILTSQGIPFWQSAEEIARTKHGISNSYNSPVNINEIDWNRLIEYKDLLDYYKGLIKIRKKYSAFRSDDLNLLDIKFSEISTPNLVAYTIKEKSKDSPILAVAFNGNKFPCEVTFYANNFNLPNKWSIIADENSASDTTLREFQGNSYVLPGQSAVILVKD